MEFDPNFVARIFEHHSVILNLMDSEGEWDSSSRVENFSRIPPSFEKFVVALDKVLLYLPCILTNGANNGLIRFRQGLIESLDYHSVKIVTGVNDHALYFRIRYTYNQWTGHIPSHASNRLENCLASTKPLTNFTSRYCHHSSFRLVNNATASLQSASIMSYLAYYAEFCQEPKHPSKEFPYLLQDMLDNHRWLLFDQDTADSIIICIRHLFSECEHFFGF